MSAVMSFHDVTKIEITPTKAFSSSDTDFNNRAIIITFDDGRTQQIDVFNHNDTLPLEIN